MNDLTKRPTEAQQAEPAAWLVLDKDGSLVHAAAHREFAHEHINDAINEHGITEAARWVVRPAFTAPIAATPAPDLCPSSGLWCAATPAPSREDGMPASADERHLRRLLAARVGMPHTYFDDGEAQGAQHGISIDFMREPVADIDAKLRALNVARYEVAKAATPAPALAQAQQADLLRLFTSYGNAMYRNDPEAAEQIAQRFSAALAATPAPSAEDQAAHDNAILEQGIQVGRTRERQLWEHRAAAPAPAPQPVQDLPPLPIEWRKVEDAEGVEVPVFRAFQMRDYARAALAATPAPASAQAQQAEDRK